MAGKLGMRSGLRGKGRGIAWIRANVSYQGDDCLRWPFGTDKGGYGQVGLNGKVYKVHRYICELVHGPAPSPIHETAHSCGKGSEGCANPRHLAWKTHSENQKDRRAHGTQNKGRRWKLTPADVAAIRASTEKPRELAARYGVGVNNIRQILWGKTWPTGERVTGGFTPETSRKALAARNRKRSSQEVQEGK